MRTRRFALLALTPLVLVLGGVVAFKATQPVISTSLCMSTMGGMWTDSPSDPALYAPGPTGTSAYTQDHVSALGAYVAAHWQRPLAVVDRETGAASLYGPRDDVTAFVYDTGALASTPCVTNIADRTQDAANFSPPHPPSIVVLVDAPSTATQTGTIPSPRTVTVEADPGLLSPTDQATLQAVAARLLAAPS